MTGASTSCDLMTTQGFFVHAWLDDDLPVDQRLQGTRQLESWNSSGINGWAGGDWTIKFRRTWAVEPPDCESAGRPPQSGGRDGCLAFIDSLGRGVMADRLVLVSVPAAARLGQSGQEATLRGAEAGRAPTAERQRRARVAILHGPRPHFSDCRHQRASRHRHAQWVP